MIGKNKFSYDMWGDTVNIASRMESFGEKGRINVSETSFNNLKNKFSFSQPKVVDVKGKGKLKIYQLT